MLKVWSLPFALDRMYVKMCNIRYEPSNIRYGILVLWGGKIKNKLP